MKTSFSTFQCHIITCEFPPQPGGISDYTCSLAEGLAAAGDEVHVWCPDARGRDSPVDSFVVHGELGKKSIADLSKMSQALSKFPAPRNILIQWVPHGYGYKSLNLPFCLWVWKRAKLSGDRVELMVHEAFLPFAASNFRQSVAAVLHRVMIITLLAAASKVWLSTSTWARRIRPYCLGRRLPFHSLPVPSNIPMRANPTRVGLIRQRYASQGGLLLGHFGTYGRLSGDILCRLIPLILDSGGQHSIILIGRGGQEFLEWLLRTYPVVCGKVYATGTLDTDETSYHIQACALMIQPYQDGITTRRTSAMACLSHGRPMVSTLGSASEPFWQETGAVTLEPTTDIAALARSVRKLVADRLERERLGEAARVLYTTKFQLSHTIAALRRERFVQEP